MEILLVAIALLLMLTLGMNFILKNIYPSSTIYARIIILIFIYSFLSFYFLGLGSHGTPHFKEIDPFIDACYTPISFPYAGWIIGLHLLSIISMVVLFINKYVLPPLIFALCIIFLILGLIPDIGIFLQASMHDTSRIHYTPNREMIPFLVVYPFFHLVLSTSQMVRLVQKDENINRDKVYSAPFLNYLNQALSKSKNLPFLSILLVLPVMLLIVLILVLFGQDLHYFQKVFTDTATWRFSQEIHPPTVDDRHGHYLCTVAACGSPRLVKPIRLGTRKNGTIIVNRQLQIANAFEYMVQQVSPSFHKLLRYHYDRYGLNLSKRINTPIKSNITYILMKPLEWIFLIALYSYFKKPEEIISRQYL